jgi:hypothetical protein
LNWRVFKRYFSLFKIIKDSYLEKYIPSILAESPGLRSSAFSYLIALGITPKRMSFVENFLLPGHCEDDTSLFEAVKCLVTWQTPAKGKIVQKMAALGINLSKKNGYYSSSSVTAAIWLLSKYGSQEDITSLIYSSEDVWKKSGWAARQIASTTPLLLEKDRIYIDKVITKNGLLQALGVLTNISSIKELINLDFQLDNYLKHEPSASWAYPLPKVILTVAILQGKLNSTHKKALCEKLFSMLTDNRYKYLISQHKEINMEESVLENAKQLP